MGRRCSPRGIDQSRRVKYAYSHSARHFRRVRVAALSIRLHLRKQRTELLNISNPQDDIHQGMMGHRSHSAAPMDSPSLRYRGRSQSPTGHRSLSPPEHRSMPYSHGYVPPRYVTRVPIRRISRAAPRSDRRVSHRIRRLRRTTHSRFSSRSATATPTGSPKRQLPLIPAALKERAAQDLEERARFMRQGNRQVHTYRTMGIGGESLLLSYPLGY